MYQEDNIFAKILKKEIPCNKIFENDFALAFADVSPKAKQHALVIPKGKYKNLSDFLQNASELEQLGYLKAIQETLKKLNLTDGYRILTNCGNHGGQEVEHLHFHILGGEPLGSPFNN